MMRSILKELLSRLHHPIVLFIKSTKRRRRDLIIMARTKIKIMLLNISTIMTKMMKKMM